MDGPGIRLVVFLQGCPLRCKYCHNPDTWRPNVGNLLSVEDILDKYDSCKEFLRDGGITVTGGEALLQMDFLIELFSAFKAKNIHTCLDTSGITFSKKNVEKFNVLMEVVDLVLLDIKHIDDKSHEELTGVSNKKIIEFAEYLCDIEKPVWIRHVVVPTITDDEKSLTELGKFLGKLKNVKALDLLAYHTMGNAKYKELGITPPLEGVPEATAEQVLNAKKLILQGILKSKNIKQ